MTTRKNLLSMADPAAPPPKLASTMKLEELENIFKTFVDAVEEMIKPDEEGKIPEVTTEDMKAAADKVAPMLSAPERIDQIVALLRHREFQEMMLRQAVSNAEKKARGHKAFISSVKGSLELYMIEKGIARIEGFASQLALYKKPDQLMIDDEAAIPEEYFHTDFTVRMTDAARVNEEEFKKAAADLGFVITFAERKLDTDKLIAKLDAIALIKKQFPDNPTPEIPGATLLKDLKRINVK
jgi:hypothetical protein